MSERHEGYELRYLPIFWDDLNGAVTYIKDVLHAPEAARRLIDETEQAILRHLGNPMSAQFTRQHATGRYRTIGLASAITWCFMW